MRSPKAGEAWDYPQPFDKRYPDDIRWMHEEVRDQKYRYDRRSPDWVGLVLAKHLGLDPRADRKKLNAILRAWYAHGVLDDRFHETAHMQHPFSQEIQVVSRAAI
jgi:hypothetical protein